MGKVSRCMAWQPYISPADHSWCLFSATTQLPSCLKVVLATMHAAGSFGNHPPQPACDRNVASLVQEVLSGRSHKAGQAPVNAKLLHKAITSRQASCVL